jgi:trigger factor
VKTDVKKLEKNKVAITIEVPPQDVAKILDKAADTLSQRVRIPGFRQGRVPRSVLEAKVGTDAITHHAMETEVPNIYREAVSGTDLEPIANPELKVIEQMMEGKKFIFEATVEVKPETKLKNYKGIKVTKPDTSVSAKDVDEEIDRIKGRFADLKVSKEKKVKKGHFAVIDFEGSIDGALFEGGSSSDHVIEVGSGSFWKGFEEQLVGLKGDEEKTIRVESPKDYYVKELAGKTVDFKVKVKEIKDKVVPPVDDKFAEKVGFKDLKALKKDVKENLVKRKKMQADMAVQTQAVEAAIKNAEVEVPQPMIDDYGERMLKEFGQSLMQRGVNVEDYLKMTNQTIDDVKANMQGEAEEMAKADLVLEALAKKEGLKVSDKEVDEEMEALIGRMGDAGKQFSEGEDAAKQRVLLRMALIAEMTKKKAADFLVEHSVEKASAKEEKKK